MAEENSTPVEEKYPSLDLVYPIAIASYDTMAKRLDAIDGRIQTLTAFALTAAIAVPTIGKGQNLSLYSIWFQLAMGGLVLAILVSVYARLTGKVRMLKPDNLLKGSLHLPQATFKTYAIHYAAEAFKANNSQLERKWKLSVVSMIIFALALGLLFVWLGKGSQT